VTTVGEALVVIDYTCDFVAPDGALTCGEPARRIDGRVAELVETFTGLGWPVVLAVDVHDPDDPHHPESRLFPPHNLRGTRGRDIYGRTGEVCAAQAARIRWMDKTRYSAFAGTDLDLWLRARGVGTLHLVGVCTDICVLHTASHAYHLGYRLVVHADAVASFHAAGHAWALDHFRTALGAEVVEGWRAPAAAGVA
jgi:nicotinamidase-related amidase